MRQKAAYTGLFEDFGHGFTLNNRKKYFFRPLEKGEKNTRRGAYTDLVQLASHRDHDGLRRGQLRTSERKLAEAWHWSRREVRVFLEKEKEDGTLTVTPSPRGTVITLLDYDEDQNAASYLKERVTGCPDHSWTTQNIDETMVFETPASTPGPVRTTSRAQDINTNTKTKISKQNAYARENNHAHAKHLPANGLPFKQFSVQEVREELDRQCAAKGVTLANPKETAYEIWFSKRGGKGGYFRDFPKLVGMWLIHLPETRLAPELQRTDEENRTELRNSIDRLVSAELLEQYRDETEYQMRVAELRFEKRWLPLGEYCLTEERIAALREKVKREGKLVKNTPEGEADREKEEEAARLERRIEVGRDPIAARAREAQRRIIRESVDRLVAAGLLDSYRTEEELAARVDQARREYDVLQGSNAYVSGDTIKWLLEIRAWKKTRNPEFGENRRKAAI